MAKKDSVSDETMARKAGVAAFVGTTVEWYDFYIYGTASALVFGKLFFPDASPATGILLSFATLWVGFLARPLGGIIFGHIGDLVGRKKALITTMMLMGLSTLAIGLMPTYATLGVLAPILLVICRFVQGLAVGGEWGGAVLIATEHADDKRSYRFGAYAQQGSPAGQLLATLIFLIISKCFTDATFDSWGWRIPFLLSVVLIVVGMFLRLRISETPAMERLKKTDSVVKFPLGNLLRNHLSLVLIGICTCAIAFTAGYFKNTFALSWAVNDVGFTKDTFLTISLIATITQFCIQPFGALMAERINVRKLVTILLLLEIPAMPLMFILTATGDFLLATIGMVIATVPHVLFYSILAGLLARSFPAEIRYTAISLTYGVTGALLGGTTPMVAQWLLSATGSIVPVIGFALITVLMSLFGANALLRRAATMSAAAPTSTEDAPSERSSSVTTS